MKQTLLSLTQILSSINDDPQKSLCYFTNSNKYRTNETTPPPDCKWILIHEALNHLNISNKDKQEFLIELNLIYTYNQHLCWKSHEHHFHANFECYVNCPMTCLGEIVEFLEKVIKLGDN